MIRREIGLSHAMLRPPSPETHPQPRRPGGEPGAPAAPAGSRRTARATDRRFTRCASPTLTARKISTYTVLGFAGYAVASLTGAALAVAWQLTLGERLIGLLVPPIVFLVAVMIASAAVRRERIVFYQAAIPGVVITALVAAIAGVRVARLVDHSALGIGTFLVFGRIGCFAVACCHGTLGRGRLAITYGAPHVRAGFWARWEGRPLWPVQLIESAASGVLVIAGIAAAGTPGTAAVVYISGYGALRFALELVRGDAVRPYLHGVSEAQWLALISVVGCAAWMPHPVALVTAAILSVATAVLVIRRVRRELFLPPHIHELDRVVARVLADPAHGRRETSCGVAVSCYPLPDGKLDWVWSSSHPAWSLAAARRLATALWRDQVVVAGRARGVIHVLVPHAAAFPAPSSARLPRSTAVPTPAPEPVEPEDDLRLN
jgi:prolipoprotein diacylglyceryltransferase